MAWINASFATEALLAEVWCDALLAAGAVSASIEDADAGTPEETPQFGEPGMESTPLWQHARISALFSENADIAACFAAIAADLKQPPPTPVLKRVEEENWVLLTQAQFEPIRISERLWIVPSWHETPDPTAINIVLDPGMAFGTGSHPTTRLCLGWLEQAIRAFSVQAHTPSLPPRWGGCPEGAGEGASFYPSPLTPTSVCKTPQGERGAKRSAPSQERTYLNQNCSSPGISLLDYGSGSGILAIAAAKLGAAPVDGLDIDPQAVLAARANAENNRVDVRFTKTPESLLPQYDLVVANILANPLRLLAPALASRVRPGGKLALSGLLAEQAEDIAALYAPWINLDHTEELEGWVCLSGTKRDER